MRPDIPLDGERAADCIDIVIAVIRDADGRVLLVRKLGSDAFIQPGGKREPGERSLDTLARELAEELGLRLRADTARPLGVFEDLAVNEPGRRVRGEAFLVEAEGAPAPAGEIAELAWIDPRAPGGLPIARLSAHHILPAVLADDLRREARR
ncbi:NUDIX hydrolase [Coralloluteibacterium thermophilus]|uniref:NUDIX domain-containing protein n=1 Tax=Coralloluteibacterium thermophilum TaxID=2707049 RepID=A0ABV9NNN2_9GAMM